MRCNQCGNEIKDTAASCEHCGAVFEHPALPGFVWRPQQEIEHIDTIALEDSVNTTYTDISTFEPKIFQGIIVFVVSFIAFICTTTVSDFLGSRIYKYPKGALPLGLYDTDGLLVAILFLITMYTAYCYFKKRVNSERGIVQLAIIIILLIISTTMQTESSGYYAYCTDSKIVYYENLNTGEHVNRQSRTYDFDEIKSIFVYRMGNSRASDYKVYFDIRFNDNRMVTFTDCKKGMRQILKNKKQYVVFNSQSALDLFLKDYDYEVYDFLLNKVE